MQIPLTAKLGIVVFLAAIIMFFGAKHCVETRTLRALDMPLSLSQGTISAATVCINVHATGTDEGTCWGASTTERMSQPYQFMRHLMRA